MDGRAGRSEAIGVSPWMAEAYSSHWFARSRTFGHGWRDWVSESGDAAPRTAAAKIDNADPCGRKSVLHELMALERSLLQPAVRASAAELDALLADEFREVGASGRAFGKDEVLARLPEESGVAFTVAGMSVQLLGTDHALVTYRAIRSGDGVDHPSLRSSLWRLESHGLADAVPPGHAAAAGRYHLTSSTHYLP
jgi:hypothetical protein